VPDDIDAVLGVVPETTLDVGVDATIRHFERLLERKMIAPGS
jgi:hypothetical protein